MKTATFSIRWPYCLLLLLGLLSYGSHALAGPTPPGNYVFRDDNQNNIFDAEEVGIPGIQVSLYTSDGVLRETTQTTATGLFSFTSTILASTSYDIRINASNAPSDRRLVLANQGADEFADSDASLIGSTAVIVAQSSPTGTLANNFGFGYAAGDPDLVLTNTSNSFSVTLGQTVSCSISVNNVGASTATGVIIRDTLDMGVEYVSSSPAGTTALLGSGQVQITWNLGTLAAGASTGYSVTVRAISDGVITNVAGVTAASADGTPRNNIASSCVTVPVKLCQGDTYVTSLSANLTNVEWFRDGVSVGTGNSLTIVTAGTYSYTSTTVGSNCQAGSCCPIIIYNGSVPNLTIASSVSAICVGESALLTANNCVGTLAWSTSATTTSITVSPVVTTTYSVTCTPTAADACPASATAIITVNPSVTATLSSATICDGTSATLVATGGTSYTFSNGTINTTGELIVSPTATTAYSVIVANSSGCTGTASATVTVNPAVTATVASATICDETSTTLTATVAGGTGFTYAWSPVGTGSTQSVVVSPSVTTTYSVTVTNSDGCSTVTSATVTVNPAVTATVASQTICFGTSTTLTASAAGGTGFTYAWLPAGTGSTQSVEVSPIATTSYSVVVTNSDGCSTTATATVTVNPATTVAIGIAPSQTICAGNTVVLTATATGGTTYSYLWSTAETTQAISVTPAVTTVYTVTAINTETGCTAIGSTTVTVNPTPVLTVNSPTICQESTAVLSLSGCEGTVAWSTGTTGAILEVTPLQTTSYTAVCTLGTGCSASIVTTVTVTPAPTVQAANVIATRATCNGATANNDASIALTGLQNTVRVSISAPDAANVPDFATATTVTGTAFTFTNLANPTQRVTYQIRLYGTDGICTSTVSVTLDPAACICPAPACVPIMIRKIN
ncbi:SdrD B-like domain-containing protein [Fibrella aquatica]|uniref:SdrD B-like domain-containing protein n=1 Tax=Fibrella aquatica TaxID=3242487 RepID=UPI00352168CE